MELSLQDSENILFFFKTVKAMRTKCLPMRKIRGIDNKGCDYHPEIGLIIFYANF